MFLSYVSPLLCCCKLVFVHHLPVSYRASICAPVYLVDQVAVLLFWSCLFRLVTRCVGLSVQLLLLSYLLLLLLLWSLLSAHFLCHSFHLVVWLAVTCLPVSHLPVSFVVFWWSVRSALFSLVCMSSSRLFISQCLVLFVCPPLPPLLLLVAPQTLFRFLPSAHLLSIYSGLLDFRILRATR
jgi:hypothetical protein